MAGKRLRCTHLIRTLAIVVVCPFITLLMAPALSSETSDDRSSSRSRAALAVSANDDLDSIIMQLPAAFRLSPHFRAFLLYHRSPNQYIYDRYIRIACGQHGVDYNLVKAIVRAESGFRPDSVSPKGAVGLMQLMPGTARNLKVKNSLDPYQNAEAGVRYLKKMLARFENNLPLAVAAYNAGPEAVEKYHGIPPFNETQLYVQVVLVLYRHYSQ
jgi:soluble lytic murein transglycosylase-like protein